MKAMSVVLMTIMLFLAGVGVYSCTMKCPTITGKRADEGWFASQYVDLSNNTSEVIGYKQYRILDVGDHYCG